MSNRLPIVGEYPADWPEINAAVCETVGHRCIRCSHPYRKGEHGKGELALCQRCHLTVQGQVKPETPWFLEHSEWFKPYVAGFYAKKYEGREITREEAMARMAELLAHEQLA